MTTQTQPSRTVRRLAIGLVADGVESLDEHDADLAESASAQADLREAIVLALDIAAEVRADPDPVLAAARRTPDEWQVALPAVRVLDTDGWRGARGRPWTDRVSRREYLERRARCTVSGPIGSDPGAGGPGADL